MVERTPDHFEPVAARRYDFKDGDLILYNPDGALVIGYARGQWLTVHYDEDYEWKSRAAVAKSRGVVQ